MGPMRVAKRDRDVELYLLVRNQTLQSDCYISVR